MDFYWKIPRKFQKMSLFQVMELSFSWVPLKFYYFNNIFTNSRVFHFFQSFSPFLSVSVSYMQDITANENNMSWYFQFRVFIL